MNHVRLFTIALSLAAASGCFSERSFRLAPRDIVFVSQLDAPKPQSTREWTRMVERRLEPLLPREDRFLGPLTTEELTDANGKPVDVFAHFWKIKKFIPTLIGNLAGISHTAQVTGSSNCVFEPVPPWDGFEDIWIPINKDVELSARVGWAKKNGKVIRSDCIVLLPGLLGDNMRLRARDIGQALRDAGYHVLSVEHRGHGRTQARFPNVTYSFGLQEAGDMLTVAEWIESNPNVRDTGMIAYSWNANLALLTSWENGRDDDHPSVSPRLKPFLRPRDGKIHYRAGIFCISPVLDFEPFVDALDRPWAMWKNPVFNAVQGTINWRAKLKGFEGVNGSLRRLIQDELALSALNYPAIMEDGFDYLRFLPYKNHATGRKLESAKVPVLILHASNDPLAYAQEIADLFAETKNPNVAGIILKGGGHDGFPAYCKDYFYSLILNFFDEQRGARNAMPRSMIARKPASGSPALTVEPTATLGEAAIGQTR